MVDHNVVYSIVVGVLAGVDIICYTLYTTRTQLGQWTMITALVVGHTTYSFLSVQLQYTS